MRRIDAKLSVYVFTEDNVYIAYCPSLDFSSCGYTIDEAKANFEASIKEYFDYCVKNKTLDADLISHGWSIEGQDICEPAVSTLLPKSKILQEVINMDNYQKYSLMAPCFA